MIEQYRAMNSFLISISLLKTIFNDKLKFFAKKKKKKKKMQILY